MKFIVTSASGKHKEKEIEFNNLEEFVAWVKVTYATVPDCRGIVFDGEEIEIYDDYREL